MELNVYDIMSEPNQDKTKPPQRTLTSSTYTRKRSLSMSNRLRSYLGQFRSSWTFTTAKPPCSRILATSVPSRCAYQRTLAGSIKMSWMDSWSRPSKSQATPAPYYLLPGGDSTPYCHSCGRVIGSRRTARTNDPTPVKYCSARCRSNKPGKLDREIEHVFVQFLTGELDMARDVGTSKDGENVPIDGQPRRPLKRSNKKQKGDHRILVSCDLVEEFMFGPHIEAAEGKDATSETDEPRGISPEFTELDHSDDHEPEVTNSPRMSLDETPPIDGHFLAQMSLRSGTRIRPPQSTSEVNGSVGGEKGRAERIEETEEMLEKRKTGQRRAKEREMVRCAARRGVIFGFTSSSSGRGVARQDNDYYQDDKSSNNKDNPADTKRKCEAVMNGNVVEPSFAKGNWFVRWRG